MNTNNNVYTVVYTTVIVVVVAAILAFVSQSLKAKQDANEKAETISQMLTSAGYGTKAELDLLGNNANLKESPFTVPRISSARTTTSRAAPTKPESLRFPFSSSRTAALWFPSTEPACGALSGDTSPSTQTFPPSAAHTSTMNQRPPALVPRSRTTLPSRPNS